MEQELEIITNGDFKNINLKSRYKRDSKGNFEVKDGKKVALQQGLEVGNHVILEKTFAQGLEITKPTYTFFNCKVKYKNTDVSFVLYKDEHDEFASTGGVGDKVKATLFKEPYVNKKTGAEGLKEVLHFEVVA
jgi:hypothetical protein